MGKKTAAQSAETKKDIVSSARRLFAEKGFAGATTREIAHAAGLTEGAFFHHFKDKRALLTTVVEQVQSEFAAQVFQSGASGEDPFQRFMLGARASLELSQQQEYLRLVLIEAPTVLGGTTWRQIDSASSLAVIEPALIAIAGNADVPEAERKSMALLVLGLLNETAFALARHDSGVKAEDVLSLLSEILHQWKKRLS